MRMLQRKSSWNIDARDGSVLTGRTLEGIAEELSPTRSANPMRPDEVPGARKTAMPTRIQPMLATLGGHPFTDPSWLFEIKWDGVRALAWITNGQSTLRSRTGRDITHNYPELASLPQRISAERAILDGEIVSLDERGHSHFERLQQRMHVHAPSASLVSQVPATLLPSSIFSTAMVTIWRRLLSINVRSSCAVFFVRMASFASPITRWNAARNSSKQLDRKALRASLQSVPTVTTSAGAAGVG